MSSAPVIAQRRLPTGVVSGWELPNLTIAIALDTHLAEARDALHPHRQGGLRRCIRRTEAITVEG